MGNRSPIKTEDRQIWPAAAIYVEDCSEPYVLAVIEVYRNRAQYPNWRVVCQEAQTQLAMLNSRILGAHDIARNLAAL